MKVSSTSLLIIRILPLTIRPIAVWLEWQLLDSLVFIPIILVVSGMVLNASAIPLHIKFYKSNNFTNTNSPEKSDYSFGLSILLVSYLPIGFIIAVILFNYDVKLALCCVLFLIIEKLFDELSRYLEFQKMFYDWFVVQVFRSTALIIVVLLCWFFQAKVYYLFSFVYSILFIILNIKLYQELGLKFGCSRSGFSHFANSLGVLPTLILPALMRNIPRMLVLVFAPSIAHVYTVAGQLSAGITILYDVMVMIPNRKVASLRPRKFHSIFDKFNTRILYFSFWGNFMFLASLGFAGQDIGMHVLALLILMILSAEALLLAVFNSYYSLLPWFMRIIRYIAVILSITFIVLIIYAGLYLHLENQNLSYSIIVVHLATSLMIFIITFLLKKLYYS